MFKTLARRGNSSMLTPYVHWNINEKGLKRAIIPQLLAEWVTLKEIEEGLVGNEDALRLLKEYHLIRIQCLEETT